MKPPLIDAHCWNDIDFEEAENLLLSSNIQKITSVYDYLHIPDRKYNPTALLLFFDNGLKAVFKPNRSPNRMQAALMAYHFSQFMDFKFVPPTVIRTINGENGVVRFFVEDVNELQHNFISNLTPLEKSNIYVFYFVLGECDANLYNVLFERRSGKPVLVDNETCLTASFMPYGDYPFRSLAIHNLKISISSPEEYERFPLKEISKLSSCSKSYLKNIFHDMTESAFDDYFIPWCFKRRPFLHDGNMYFVRWNNAYWIRKNFMYYEQIYKNFLPQVFSEKTICQLRKIDCKSLRSFLPNFFISNTILFGILHRRDVILKEASRLNKFCN